MKLRRASKNGKTPAAPKKKRVPAAVAAVKSILVPIDFSDYSKNALQYAASIGRQFGAELLLIYVVEPTIYPADFSFGQVVLPNIEKELQERGQTELNDLASKLEGVAVKTLVRTGKPFLEIVRTAEEKDIDLIVMATHGHTGMEHLIFGGTAEKVIRKAPCPVLMLRPEEG
jgi:nucleotide-binding universal stress UspA family protein